MDNLDVFYQRLLELRKKNKLTQRDVASGLGITVSHYQYYERGYREPKLTTLLRFCEYYEVSADYMTGRTDNPKINKI